MLPSDEKKLNSSTEMEQGQRDTKFSESRERKIEKNEKYSSQGWGQKAEKKT